MKKKHSAFDAINSTILVLIALVMLYPFWYVLMGSLMTNAESMVNPYKLFAKFPTLEAYKIFFENTSMVSNLLVSTYITLAGHFSAWSLHPWQRMRYQENTFLEEEPLINILLLQCYSPEA